MTASGDLRRVAAQLKSVPRQWVEQAVKDLQQAVKPSLSRDTGGDAVLSGMGGKKLTVSTRVDGDDLVTGEVVAAGNKGAWRIIEEGTRGRPQGGSSPERLTWAKAVEPVLPRLIDDADRRVKRSVQSG